MTLRTRLWLAAPVAALALLSLPLNAHAQATPPAAAAPAGSDLSPAQQGRMQARQEHFQKDVAALKADKALTDAQKKARYLVLAQAADKDMMAILTPAQRERVMSQRQIGTQLQKEAAALQADKTLTDAQKRARYQTLLQAANDKALATLTPEQRAQVLKRRQIAADATRMGKELQKSLTPAQEKQIHGIGLASGTQIQAVIADKSVSEQAKVAKIATLRQQAQAKINAVLTPAQRAKYARLQQMVSAPPAQ